MSFLRGINIAVMTMLALFSAQLAAQLQARPARIAVVAGENEAKTRAILDNTELMKLIWATAAPDLKDLANFLQTLRSPKYDSERLLGRWNFDVHAAVAAYRKLKPNLASTEMQRMRRLIEANFAKASLVAMPDQHALLKNITQLKVVPSAAPATGQVSPGQWAKTDGKYQLTFSLEGREQQIAASIEGDRLTLNNEGNELVLLRED